MNKPQKKTVVAWVEDDSGQAEFVVVHSKMPSQAEFKAAQKRALGEVSGQPVRLPPPESGAVPLKLDQSLVHNRRS